MKPIVTLCILFSMLMASTAQAQLTDSLTFKRRYYDINKAHAITLTSWSAVNIIGSGSLALTQSGQAKHFNTMNASWGLINGTISTFMLLNLKKEKNAGYSLYEDMERQHKLEKILLLNTGLDAAYMLGGVALNYYGQLPQNANRADRLQGFGKSIIIQGGFLLLQDVVFYALHAKNRKRHSALWKSRVQGY
jgi:hypothetical protein